MGQRPGAVFVEPIGVSMGPPVPMYEMRCACGRVWYTTRATARSDDTCRDETGKGCGRRLPAPVPEKRAVVVNLGQASIDLA